MKYGHFTIQHFFRSIDFNLRGVYDTVKIFRLQTRRIVGRYVTEN